MTINSPTAYVAGIWDWSTLDGCFGKTAIHPGDIDGCVERHGFFLFLENKDDGVDMKSGQRILLTKLSEQPNTLCLFFNGNALRQSVSRIFIIADGSWRKASHPSLECLRGIVADWYWWAEEDADLAAAAWESDYVPYLEVPTDPE